MVLFAHRRVLIGSASIVFVTSQYSIELGIRIGTKIHSGRIPIYHRIYLYRPPEIAQKGSPSIESSNFEPYPLRQVLQNNDHRPSVCCTLQKKEEKKNPK